MSRFARPALALTAAVLLLSTACGDDADSDAGPDTQVGGQGADEAVIVAVGDDFFEPEEVSVVTGEQVTWTWEGSNPHNVSSDEFQSELQSDGTFEHTFDEAGTFDYICTVHPSMTGSVTVTEQ